MNEELIHDLLRLKPARRVHLWLSMPSPTYLRSLQTTSSIAINYIISRLLNRDSLRVRLCTVGSGIRANWLPTHPTYHLLARNGNLDKAVAACLFMVTKGTKHGLCTLSKVEKGASPSWVSRNRVGPAVEVPDEARGTAETLATL